MILRYYYWLAIIALITIFQAILLPALFSNCPGVNILLCVCLVVVILGYAEEALLIAFFSGLFLDFFSFTSLGFTSLFYIAITYLSIELRQIFGANLITFSIICFGSSLLFRYFFGFIELSIHFAVGGFIDLMLFWLFRFSCSSFIKKLLKDDGVQLDFYSRL